MRLTSAEIESLVIPIRTVKSLRTWEKVQDMTAADVGQNMNNPAFVRRLPKIIEYYEDGMSNLLLARILNSGATEHLWGIGGHSVKSDWNAVLREEEAMGLTHEDMAYLVNGFYGPKLIEKLLNATNESFALMRDQIWFDSFLRYTIKCPRTASFPEAMRMLKEFTDDLASKGLLDDMNDSDLDMINKCTTLEMISKCNAPEDRNDVQQPGPKFEGDNLIAF
ncbi:hypothetical protein ACHAPU_002037 [Fusarium lateritium]